MMVMGWVKYLFRCGNTCVLTAFKVDIIAKVFPKLTESEKNCLADVNDAVAGFLCWNLPLQSYRDFLLISRDREKKRSSIIELSVVFCFCCFVAAAAVTDETSVDVRSKSFWNIPNVLREDVTIFPRTYFFLSFLFSGVCWTFWIFPGNFSWQIHFRSATRGIIISFRIDFPAIYSVYLKDIFIHRGNLITRHCGDLAVVCVRLHILLWSPYQPLQGRVMGRGQFLGGCMVESFGEGKPFLQVVLEVRGITFLSKMTSAVGEAERRWSFPFFPFASQRLGWRN